MSVLKNKNFVLYFLGMLVSDIGNLVYNFAIGWYILTLDLTGTIFEQYAASLAGIYLATGSIVYLVLANFGAAFVDRMDKIKIMYVTDFIRGISILIAGYIIFKTDDITIILITLFTTTIIISIFGALFGPATQTLLKYIVEEDKLQQANSIFSIKNSLQGVIFTAIAGIIYGLIGVAGIFIVNGISYILSGVSEIFIDAKTQEEVTTPTTFKQILIDIKEGWIYIYNKKAIFRIMTYAILFNLGFNLLFAIGFVYLFNKQLNVSINYYAITSVIFALSSTLIGFYLSVKPQKEKMYNILIKNVVGLFLMITIILTIMQLMISTNVTFIYLYVLLSIGLFILGIFNTSINIPMQTLLIKEIDKEMMARAMIAIQIMTMGSLPLAAAFGGWIIDMLGLSFLLLLVFIILLIPTVFMFKDKHIKDL